MKQCADLFAISSEQLAEAVAQTNEFYGGYDIRSSRIVFPNGDVDPWHALGITQNITSDLPAVFIKGEKNSQTSRSSAFNGDKKDFKCSQFQKATKIELHYSQILDVCIFAPTEDLTAVVSQQVEIRPDARKPIRMEALRSPSNQPDSGAEWRFLNSHFSR